MAIQSQSASPRAPLAITAAEDSQKNSIDNGDRTNDTELQLSGTADITAVLTLFDNGVNTGVTASVGDDGNWDLPATAALGAHSFTVRAGSGADSPPWLLTVVPFERPAPVVIQAPGGVLNPIAAINGATVVVSYTVMIPTDLIGLSWNGLDNLVPAQPGNTLGSVSFTLPASAVAAVIGKTIPVIYTVVRKGVALPSATLNLTVQTLPDSVLTAPKILQAANNGEGPELDVTALTAGATVRVNDWPFIALDQYVWLRLKGTKADGSAVTLELWKPPGSRTNAQWIREGYYDKALTYDNLKDLKDGSTVTLEFRAGLGGSQVESEAITFPLRTYTVKALEIVAPRITLVTDSAGVDIPDNGNTFDTRVTVIGTASVDQRVELFDGTTSLGIATATGTSWTLPLTGLTAKAYNIRAKGLYGSNPESAVRTFTVQQAAPPFVVDPTTIQLPGLMVILVEVGFPGLLGGAFADRKPTGGVPPYTYLSSNSAVAAVDEGYEGRVLSRGNGSAVITIRDSLGAAGSYTVQVSNVFRGYYLGMANYPNSVNAASARGLRVPTIGELNAIYLGYSRYGLLPPSIPYVQYWTSMERSPGYNVVQTIQDPVTSSGGLVDPTGPVLGAFGVA